RPHTQLTLFPYTTLFRSRRGLERRRSADATQRRLLRRRLQGSLLDLTIQVRGDRIDRTLQTVLRHVDQDRFVSVLGEDVGDPVRSEEHTSELQSRENLVC